MSLALHPADAGALQKLMQRRLRELRAHRDGRHVAAADQRIMGTDRAGETAIEILRRERTERGRRILEDRHRMQDALIERQAVDERLQR